MSRPVSPSTVERHRGALFLGIIVLVGAFVTVEATSWLGRGIALVLPDGWMQITFGVVLATALVTACLREQFRTSDGPWRANSVAVATAAATALVTLAPIGRGNSPTPGAAAHASDLIVTIYAAYPLIALALWLPGRRRRALREQEMMRKVAEQDAQLDAAQTSSQAIMPAGRWSLLRSSNERERRRADQLALAGAQDAVRELLAAKAQRDDAQRVMSRARSVAGVWGALVTLSLVGALMVLGATLT